MGCIIGWVLVVAGGRFNKEFLVVVVFHAIYLLAPLVILPEI